MSIFPEGAANFNKQSSHAKVSLSFETIIFSPKKEGTNNYLLSFALQQVLGKNITIVHDNDLIAMAGSHSGQVLIWFDPFQIFNHFT